MDNIIYLVQNADLSTQFGVSEGNLLDKLTEQQGNKGTEIIKVLETTPSRMAADPHKGTERCQHSSTIWQGFKALRKEAVRCRKKTSLSIF